MSENIKYVTDASLARLAKWLRLLGYDTIVFPHAAGRDLLNIASAEGRIVLTRRLDLPERQFACRLYLVKGKAIGGQLSEVINQFSLKIEKEKLFRICLKCNEKLTAAAKEEVRNLVPEFVFANCGEYNKCPHCRKIYWAGTHQRNALRFLDKNVHPADL
ncbi:MAG: hypothetical protein CVU54_05105 [Deltaproteobacteria bacterium HGW-Deltaproteobacteria-12]|jgi:hypothetical protein|nr:MAG: hypothetical protein CVU54_05105 [Deltaproteobacteria bacterium HGW-Deltaproteobacteria-12]